MDDDLFKPTIGDFATMGKPPFNVSSLVYPALIGGPLAITALGVLNGQRIGLPRSIVAVAATGALATAAELGVIGAAVARPESMAAFTENRGATLLNALLGAAVYAVVVFTQRPAFRSFQLRGGEPAKLLWPAVLAILAAALVMIVAACGIVAVIR